MWKISSRTRSSSFLAGYPGTMSHKPPSTVWLILEAFLFLQVLPSINKLCPSDFLREIMKCSWDLRVVWTFRKSALTECSPPSLLLFGTKSWMVLYVIPCQRNLNASSEDMYPAAPEPIIRLLGSRSCRRPQGCSRVTPEDNDQWSLVAEWLESCKLGLPSLVRAPERHWSEAE
jgi:hypothetical protein